MATTAKIGQTVGYVRVSSASQNTARQLDGLELDRVFEEKASGGKAGNARPVLQECLRFVREGDTLVVHSMDRLARNLADLLDTVNDLTKRGVAVRFVKENLTFSGNDSPMNRLMLAMLGGVAEFERSMIRERQMEGIAIAKAAGVYKGRPQSVTPEQVAALRDKIALGVPLAKAARIVGVSRSTAYAYLAQPADQAGA